MNMKIIVAILAIVGALFAHADEGGSRTFEITVREVLPDGKDDFVGRPATITVHCGNPGEVRMEQNTTYPSNPPQTGPAVVFTGKIETGGCKP